MSKTMTLRPRISEKAYGQSQSLRVYVFEVPEDSNKMTIKQAVQEQFSVSVTNVNVINSIGKVKRTVRRNGRAVSGRRASGKKAYVTLKEGDEIAIFANEEDAKKTDETQTTRKRTRKGEK